jgi:hypothetical protein
MIDDMLSGLLSKLGAVSFATIGFGLVSAAGVFLTLAGLGLFDAWIPIARWAGRLSQSTTIEEERARMASRSELRLIGGNLLERAVAPLALVLMRRAPTQHYEWIEMSYDLLGRDKGATDFYVRQILSTLAGFCTGTLFGTALAFQAGLVAALLILPVGLAVLFYRLPEFELKSDLARRREQILYEMPHTIDKLLVNVMAYRNIADGIKHTVDDDANARYGQLLAQAGGELAPRQVREFLSTQAIRDVGAGGGGYFARELMQVYSESLKNGNLKAALLRMARRNSDVNLVSRFAERVAMSYESGASLITALTDIGRRANEMVENKIQSRGEQNLQAMIAPSAIALAGVFAAVGAPAAAQIFRSI